jgi:hypothetical protein
MSSPAFLLDRRLSPLGLDRERRRFFDRRAVPLYVIAAVQSLMIMTAVGAGVFTWDAQLFATFFQGVGVFLSLAFAARWIGFEKLAAPVEMFFLALTIAFLGAMLAVVLAASALPLRDDLLGWVDRVAFGFERTAMDGFFAARPALMRVAVWIYNSLGMLTPLLTTWLVAAGRTGRAWTVLTAMMLTGLVAMLVMPLAPAHGAANHAFNANIILDGVRSGELRRLDQTVVTGLIVFPSLHAANAVILMWGFDQFGRLGAPLVALSALVFGTALVVGGHYLVDLVAGAALACAAIAVALRWERRLSVTSAGTRTNPSRR